MNDPRDLARALAWIDTDNARWSGLDADCKSYGTLEARESLAAEFAAVRAEAVDAFVREADLLAQCARCVLTSGSDASDRKRLRAALAMYTEKRGSHE